MIRGCLLLGIGFFTWTSLLTAAEPLAPTPIIRQEFASPAGTDVPANSVTVAAESRKPLNADQLNGMRQAVQMLDEAKYTEAADALRRKIAELEQQQVQLLLAQKTQELAALQDEIARLRTADNPLQIMLSFQVFEYSRTKLHDIGFKGNELIHMPDAKETGSRNNSQNIIDDPKKVSQLIAELKAKDVMKIQAVPTVVTQNGRPVHFHSGGEVPVPPAPGQVKPGEPMKIGTMIDATPLLQEDGHVKLDFRLTFAELDPSLNVAVGDKIIPGIRRKQVAAGGLLRSDQTLVMRGLPQQRLEVMMNNGKRVERVNEIETLILVRPSFPIEAAIGGRANHAKATTSRK